MATKQTPTPPPEPPIYTETAPMNYTGAAEGAAFIPDEGGGARAKPVPKCEPIPAFQLKVHPNRWTIMEGAVIPAVGRVKHRPGVDGAAAVYDHTGKFLRVNAGLARSQAEDQGWKLIPYDKVPHSLCPAGSYIWRPDGRPDVHLLFTERVYNGSTRIDGDTKTYVAWMKWLMTPAPDGSPPFIAPPADYVLEGMREKLAKDRDSAINRAQSYPAYRSVADTLSEHIAIIDRELAARHPVAATGAAYSPEA